MTSPFGAKIMSSSQHRTESAITSQQYSLTLLHSENFAALQTRSQIGSLHSMVKLFGGRDFSIFFIPPSCADVRARARTICNRPNVTLVTRNLRKKVRSFAKLR